MRPAPHRHREPVRTATPADGLTVQEPVASNFISLHVDPMSGGDRESSTMKWLSFFNRKENQQSGELLDRYKHLREVGRNLNVTLARQLPKPAVPECGKRLGIFKSGNLILNNDDEIGVLYDYCLYHHRRGGKNIIERTLEQSPPAPESAEMELLQAMLQAHFSVFRVDRIVPHRGAKLTDLVTGESFTLVDIGLSSTGMEGVILAGRILSLADLTMSSGALIPVPEVVFDRRIDPVIRTFMKNRPSASGKRLAPAREAAFAAQVLRIALHAGGEDNTFYSDIEH